MNEYNLHLTRREVEVLHLVAMSGYGSIFINGNTRHFFYEIFSCSVGVYFKSIGIVLNGIAFLLCRRRFCSWRMRFAAAGLLGI